MQTKDSVSIYITPPKIDLFLLLCACVRCLLKSHQAVILTHNASVELSFAGSHETKLGGIHGYLHNISPIQSFTSVRKKIPLVGHKLETLALRKVALKLTNRGAVIEML